MRVELFQEFPYLYKGDLNFEKKYMAAYADDPRSTLAVATVNNEIAGFSTGIPLLSNSEIVSEAKKLYQAKGFNPQSFYYYGEVLVSPKFRELGLTKMMYTAQDKIIKAWNYKATCILTVIRQEHHPLKPKDYNSPDLIWKHLGFVRSDLKTSYLWPTIQSDLSIKEVNNEMEFWNRTFPM